MFAGGLIIGSGAWTLLIGDQGAVTLLIVGAGFAALQLAGSLARAGISARAAASHPIASLTRAPLALVGLRPDEDQRRTPARPTGRHGRRACRPGSRSGQPRLEHLVDPAAVTAGCCPRPACPMMIRPPGRIDRGHGVSRLEMVRNSSAEERADDEGCPPSAGLPGRG